MKVHLINRPLITEYLERHKRQQEGSFNLANRHEPR